MCPAAPATFRMRSSRILLAGGLLLLAAGLWFVLAQDPSAAIGGETEAAASERPHAPAAADAAGDAAASDLDRVAASAAAAESALDWTRAAGPRFTLRVLDMFERTPIPAAALWVFDPSHYDRTALRAALKLAHDDWEQVATRFARRVTADERGEISLPQPAEWFRILGRDGARYGELYHPRGPDGQTALLHLEPDRTLRVRATDARGAPLAGLPVGLREERGDWAWWRAKRDTDAEGRAVFAHLQDELAGEPSQRIMLAAAIPHRDAPELAIRLDALPVEEQLLVIPAHGSLRVRLFDADKRPLKERARVVVQGAWTENRPEWFEESEGFQELASHGAHAVDAEDGVALFPCVGVGLALTVAVDFDGTENWETIECSGPATAGTEATAEVFQRVLRPTLLARLLGPDRQPLRDTAVLVQDRFESANWTSVSPQPVRTDGEGRVRRAIGEDWAESEPGSRRWLEFVREADPAASASALGARIAGRADWRAGVNDLGDVQLEVLPLLVTGRVVDAVGAPIAHADVALAQRFQRNRGRETWRAESDTRTQSDRDGRFAVHGFAREGTFRVEARHRDFPLAFVPWVAGGEEHLIQFAGGLFVRGQILRDPATAYAPLNVQLVEAGTDRARSQTRVERSGLFRCGPGAPELADLLVREEASERVLWRIPGVRAHALEAAPDARLDPLDLRSRIKLVEVHCTTPDGNVVAEDLMIAWTPDPAPEPPEDWTWAGGGQFSFLVGEEPQRLWISGEGYKRKDLSVRGERLDVTMEPGPRLQLVLTDPSVLELGERVYAELAQWKGDQQENSWWIQLNGAETEHALSVPDEYRVRLYVAIADEDGDWDWHPYPLSEPLRLQVRDVVGLQPVRLPWTAAEIRADLAARQAGD
jgi:hypothetical protein